MFRPLAASFCCLLFLVSLPGEFAQTNECNEEKILDAIGCFVRPITDLLPDLQIAENLNPTGRKLQSLVDTSIKDVRKRMYYMDKIGNDLREIGANLKNLIVKSRTKKLQKAEALKMIRSFNKTSGLQIFMNHIHSTFTPIGQYINHLKQNSKNDEDFRFKFLYNTQDASARNIDKLFGMLECIGNITEYEKFEDGFEFMECFYDCDSLPTIGTCLQDTFSNCTDGTFTTLRNIIMRVFVEAMKNKLKDCFFKVEDKPIEMTEGEDGKLLEFSLYGPPFLYCTKLADFNPSLIEIIVNFLMGEEPSCNVQVEMSNKNYLNELLPDIAIDLIDFKPFENPKCKDGTAINQFSIGCESCNITINEDNWMNTWNVTLKPTIDRKNDGKFEGRFGLKLFVNDEHEVSKSLKVTVNDKDPENPRICRVLTNGHIVTFDDRFYNNFYDGYFVLYQTNDTNYEVQTVHQRCENEATCVCAVFVRSMNDVFAFDMCRKKNAEKPKSIQFSAFVHGEVTIGTKVYIRDKGMRYEVVLPSGTSVKIAQHGFFLHVYVTGTPANFERTRGLCGFHNGNSDDDLMLRDGSLFTGNGTGKGEQPKKFNLDWRVPDEEKLYDGSNKAERTMPIGFCRCNHVLLLGVEGSCDHGAVETCNILGDDITHHLPIVTRRTKKSFNDTVNDNYDINLDWEPEDLPDYNGTNPLDFCYDQISQNALISTHCGLGDIINPFNFDLETDICVQDIKKTQDLMKWTPYSIEGAKERCITQLFWLRLPLFNVLDGYERFLNKSCINDCNKEGTCKNDGSCQCSANMGGGDCSLVLSDTNLQITSVLRDGLCDTRKENCSSIVVFGNNIMNRQEIQCDLEEIRINGKDIKYTGKKHKVAAEPVSNSQFYCPIPKVGSYKGSIISPKQGGKLRLKRSVSAFMETFLFISHDTACYSCQMQGSSPNCQRRDEKDHCVINDDCFMDREEKPNDDCKICNATLSNSAWSFKNEKKCKDIERAELKKEKDDKRLKKIRIGVSVSLSVIIIIIAIILYIVVGRHEKPVASDSELDDESNIKEFKTGNGTAGYDNEVFTDEDLKHPFEKFKIEERARAMSSSSIGSIGIGGAGPTSFSKPTFTHVYDRTSYRSRENSQSGTLPRRNQVGNTVTSNKNATLPSKTDKKDEIINTSTQL